MEVFFEGVRVFSGEEKATKQWLETLHMKYTPDAKKWLRELVKANILKKGIREATQKDIEELAKVRKLYGAGKRKNVAFTRGEVGGKKIDLLSRSGGEKGQKFDNFNPIDPEDYHYTDGPLNFQLLDCEQKQIEHLYQMFKNNKKVSGKIEIVSDLKICPNCESIINQFEKDFRNIEITRVWVKEVL